MSSQINKEAFEGEVFTIDMYFSFRWEEGRGVYTTHKNTLL